MLTDTARPHLDAAVGGRIADVVATSIAWERAGIARVVVPEITHDPFMSLAASAAPTERIQLASGVTVAFARSPMTTAYAAWGLQDASGGRAILGLGSQVKSHIRRRYDMPWSAPIPRMSEYIKAVRAIWASWTDGTALNVAGEHYRFDLMPPMFRPEPLAGPPPPIVLAGLGPRMCALAAEVADGLMLHPFSTRAYVADVVLPAVADAGPSTPEDRDLEISAGLLVATGTTDADLAAAHRALRARLAFYASTPAYRGVLTHHGWDALHEKLHELSVTGQWSRMPDLISDDMCDTLAVVGRPDEIAATVVERYAGLAHRVVLYTPDDRPGPAVGAIAQAARARR
ncbi:TIGR03617 family F420-dependent LLM class oxidoreductase [Gordonia sp. TBRC 11910]|uniref:TIGR03617 family F420-dependent LLM class oxidoreductase n=1 Tax=Gordonia asplenii TaxID=2725283 RepID=A0A848L2T0_9ACTN|nr:TIGR03617 family F420-dependent LLM class oxidoreductase [Gordonia asplenii]NMO05144.1 TIGR03617 family F420-dependent LLM class oxidoreductase [Gordonia asplenii]